MPRSVAEKTGLTAGTRASLRNAPELALAAIDPPVLDVAVTLQGAFGSIHLFARAQAELDDLFSKPKTHLAATGMLWVSRSSGRYLVGYQVHPSPARKDVRQQFRSAS